MKPLLAALIFVLLAAPSQAKVLIYKGSLKTHTLAPPVAVPAVINIFILVDPDGAQFATVAYSTLQGKKTLSKGDPVNLHLASAALPNGKTETAIVSDGNILTFADADDFTSDFTDLLGVNATLMFKTGGGVETINFPRSLTFTAHFNSSGGGHGSIQVITGLMSYQTKPSVTENDASHTLQQAIDGIAADLTSKGYMP